MTLRSRLALAVGLLVALGIVAAGAVSFVTTQRELRSEVDDFLRARADSVVALGDLSGRNQRPGRGDNNRADNASAGGFQLAPGALDQADAITQVLDSAGEVRLRGQVVLPVNDRDQDLAGSKGRSQLRTVEIDGVSYRVITASLDNGALQVGRDLSEIDRALDGLARNTIGIGLIGAGLAALAAWVLASRVARPIAQLTGAAEHVATTQDLSSTIEVRGNDEVGRLAGSFNTMLSALDTSRQQQRRLVMDASHELRTPLTSLRTNVDLLKRATYLPADQRGEVIDAVDVEIDELAGLVTELVDLATASSRPEEPVVATDFAALVIAIVERFQRRVNRPINLMIGDHETIDMRASLIDRAVSNLIDNALKFSADDDAVDVVVQGPNIEVRDYGPGIPAEDRAHIFDRFYRATVTRSMPGSGLGLAIVHEVVTQHGGEVFIADPASGPGVVIGFTLPA